LFDLSATYAFTPRFSLTLGIPFQLAERSQTYTDPTTRTPVRYSTHGNGLGDMRLLGSWWLLDPAKNTKQNISLGLGMKFPTGDENVVDTFKAVVGGKVVNQDHAVDQSIQPGDGGWDIILDLLAFKEVFKNTTLYMAGTYFISPQEQNGVLTARGNIHEAVESVTDSYLGRLGVGYALFPKHGFSLNLAWRIEGVPVRDLVGGSEGFRRPGLALSIEPGFVWAKNKNTFSVSAPVAVYRNRERSVPDIETSPTAHGDAAFADYLILFGFSRRF
jgi:hypothetical protein